jgi:hypothetical protein
MINRQWSLVLAVLLAEFCSQLFASGGIETAENHHIPFSMK